MPMKLTGHHQRAVHGDMYSRDKLLALFRMWRLEEGPRGVSLAWEMSLVIYSVVICMILSKKFIITDFPHL